MINNNLSLGFKITLGGSLLSLLVLIFVYISISNVMQEKIYHLEYEKGEIIAQTLEPTIAMNYYLSLDDENKKILEQTVSNPSLLGIGFKNEHNVMFYGEKSSEQYALKIEHTVTDPLSNDIIGKLTLFYSKQNYLKAIDDVQQRVLSIIVVLTIIMFLFMLGIRFLLKPLTDIATKLSNYTPGTEVDFSTIRTEKEIQKIIDAFYRMFNKIREHTLLLEQYRHAVDVSAIVSKTDANGNITYVNNEFVNISGFSREELIGKDHNIVCHQDMSKELFKKMWTTLKAKESWQGIIKNRKKDGTSYYVRASIVPMFNENGEIQEYIAIRQDITKVIKQQEQISRQTKDIITGLPNHVKLMEDIQKYKIPKFAVIELDNFKVINDYYGYEIGNTTLIETAQLLSNMIKEKEFKLYKLAPSEFGILMGDQVDVDLFYNTCKNILKTIEDFVITIGDNSLNIQATAGLSVEANNIVTNAQLALQHARETNRKSLLFENADNLIEHYENNLKWTKELRDAIKDNRIITYAQPILNLKENGKKKYECLIRMIDSSGNVISPFFFLDIAKKTKLYSKLTQIVIEQSFSHFSNIDAEFSVNISVDDIANDETSAFIKDKIISYGIAEKLVFELVESEGIENFTEVSHFIADVKALNCKIAIDDFGTGYSNFAYLMKLNADYIKVDGSLIKNIHQDNNSEVISKTLLDFSQKMGMETIGEFVHSAEVLEKIQEMGFDYAQGYYLGEPVPLSEIQ